MIVRCAVSELPDYIAAPNGGNAAGCHHGLQLLCPSMQYLDNGYADYLKGKPSENPGASAMTFSSVDPALATPDKHTLFIWGPYYPFDLSNGENWDDIQEREADKLIEVVNQYALNVRDSIIDRFTQLPLDLERRIGLLKGNVMHVEMEFDQSSISAPYPKSRITKRRSKTYI